MANRVHVHMNSTKWTSLTSFLQYLGREGKAVVDQTEKGWFIRWVNRDPEAIARKAAIEKREAGLLDAEERAAKILSQTVALANAQAAAEAVTDPLALSNSTATELKRDQTTKIAFSLSLGGPKKDSNASAAAAAAATAETSAPNATATATATTPTPTVPVTANGTTNSPAAPTATAAPTAATHTSGVASAAAALIKQQKELKSLNPKIAFAFGAVRGSGGGSGGGSSGGGGGDDTSSSDRSNNHKKLKAEGGGAVAVGEDGGSGSGGGANANPNANGKRKAGSALESVMLAHEASKQHASKRVENWIVPGIWVKVLNKKLADGKFAGRKAIVRSVRDKFTAQIEITPTAASSASASDDKLAGTKLSIDQIELQTVIPALGHAVRILNGAYRGETATLVSIDVDKACATVKITGGLYNGRTIDRVEYEDFSKTE